MIFNKLFYFIRKCFLYGLDGDLMAKRSREESSWCTIESDPGNNKTNFANKCQYFYDFMKEYSHY